ncbi:MAG: DNA translocase FtsK, partial [bacterium]|nr:DNA translocase FtsK [bacterium]
MFNNNYNQKAYISYKRDVLALFLFVLALFIGCALYSYSPHDSSWFHYSTHPVQIHNWCGLVGAHVAALLMYLFGGASIILSFLLGFSATIIILHRSLWQEWERIASWSILLLISAGLSYFHAVDFFHSMYPGGLVGSVLNIFLFRFFDRVGSALFLYLLLYVCLILLLRFSFIRVVRAVVHVAHVTYQLVVAYRVVQRCYAGARLCILFMIMPFVWLKQWVSSLIDGSAFQDTDLLVPAHEDDENQLYESAMYSKNVELESAHMQQQVPSVVQPVHDEDEHPKESIQDTSTTYLLPTIDIFVGIDSGRNDAALKKELEERALTLQEKLERFGVYGQVTSIKRGPVVTLFEYQPQIDTKLSKILSLEDDLAMALQAHSIRILAPIPGRSVVGFEVANTYRLDVLLADTLQSKEYQEYSGTLPLILGKDTSGTTVIVDLARMPHLLIAGSTGSGKSVALNAMLISLLCSRTPDELKLILIDPKRLEFASYADIAHLLFPIATEARHVIPILRWVVQEMEQRYKQMAGIGARTIFDYNKLCKHVSDVQALPLIVVVIDEFADLMITAGRDIEDLIVRITQMARAAGIHLIIATQRPSVDVITGLIKVNFPSRISFRVTSRID